MKLWLPLTLAYWAIAIGSYFAHRSSPAFLQGFRPDAPSYWFYAFSIFVALCAWARPVANYFRSITVGPRTLTTVFVLLVLTGHLAVLPRGTFPFVNWEMYTRANPSDEVVFYEYQGVRSDSSRIALNPVRLVPSLDQSRFYNGFGQGLNFHLDQENAAGIDVRRRFLLNLAALHNRLHHDSIEQVEVVRGVASFEDGLVEIDRSLLFTAR